MATSPALITTGAASSGQTYAWPRKIVITESGDSSSIRIDHGGSSELRNTNAPRALGPASTWDNASIPRCWHESGSTRDRTINSFKTQTFMYGGEVPNVQAFRSIPDRRRRPDREPGRLHRPDHL